LKGEKMIKILISFFTIINIFLYASVLNAGEIYYWTDKNGEIHITDTPPPQDAEHKETIRYKDSTPQKIEDFQQERKQDSEKIESEKKSENALKDQKERQIEIKKRKVEIYRKRLEGSKRRVEEAKRNVEEARDNLLEAERRAGETGKLLEKRAEESLKSAEDGLKLTEDELEYDNKKLGGAERDLYN
jgi:predicted RNase H-like nuclease (RuvC/YqgF family)